MKNKKSEDCDSHTTVQRDQRHLLYYAGKGLGIGHVLVSMSVYADYAQRTGRKFHIMYRDCVLAVDPKADVDPFFERFFDLSKIDDRRVNVSTEQVLQSLDGIRNGTCRAVVVGNPIHGLHRLRKAFSRLRFFIEAIRGNRNLGLKRIGLELSRSAIFRKTDFIGIAGFKHYIESGDDHPADYIVVDSVSPVSASDPLQGVARYSPFPFFRSDIRFPGLQGLNVEKLIGIHVRHGNGEHLHGRTEGDSTEFDDLLVNVEKGVDKYLGNGNGIIAFSDNKDVVRHFTKSVGAIDVSTNDLSDLRHADYTGCRKNGDMLSALTLILRDFYVLSSCQKVFCGTSLFTVAAYIFSKRREFNVIGSESSE